MRPVGRRQAPADATGRTTQQPNSTDRRSPGHHARQTGASATTGGIVMAITEVSAPVTPLAPPETITVTAEYHEWLAAQAAAMPSAEYLAGYGVQRLGEDDPMVIAYRAAQAEARRRWDAYRQATA